MLLAALITLTGCAHSRAAGDGQPCVEQPSCVIGCVASNNKCDKERKDGAD